MSGRSTCNRDGRAVRAIAHDLNNLLTVIMNGAAVGSALAQEEGEQARVAFERVKLLVRRLLSGPEEPAAVDIALLAQKLRPTLESVLHGRTQRLRMDLHTDPSTVLARPHDLEQVLSNLVINAAQALGDSPGEVTVATRSVSRAGRAWVLLSVEDTGPGIDPARIARIFEEGFTTKGSTGLGLSLVREVVEGLGGTIAVQASSRGARFEVSLPA